ncbi:unnamed protein product [Rotaria sp. Silwood2]|nr:unnamed protein product [Rotaria sp. Silwood2]CAF4098397.1 unnamed protein product [Rotaria sp. Silwood2]CAF4226549.1 unnamed protein product [Rotaria sp. Silwood2]CAF4470601.1 unnamed protein product [Rotaria sp. Silwood2]
MSLFIPNLITPTSRNQIKKSMSDRSTKSPESLSTSPKLANPLISSSRTLSNSDTSSSSSTPTAENTNKKSSFNLFDSILQRSVTKPLTINTSTHHDITQQKKLPTPSLSSSISNTQLPEQARCLHSYNAIKEDEICVHKGEYVQIVAANQDNRWFVHRDANRTSPAAEGWIPGFVLGLKNPNSTIHHNLSPSPPPPPTSSSSQQQPTSSLSANSLHRLTTTTSTTHHPTITYESTLPPKPQTSTCDKRLSGVLRYCGPELNISVHERNIFLGQSLILQGHVIGNPRPAIVWQHPHGHTLVDDDTTIHTHYGDDGTIYLQVCI